MDKGKKECTWSSWRGQGTDFVFVCIKPCLWYSFYNAVCVLCCIFERVLGFAFFMKPLSLRRWDKEKRGRGICFGMRGGRWSACFIVMLIWLPCCVVRLGFVCHGTEFRLFLSSFAVTAALDEAVAIATRSHPSWLHHSLQQASMIPGERKREGMQD